MPVSAESQPPTLGRAFLFRSFELFPEQRLLREGDNQVRLGSLAFDILAALVERAGEVVGKEELIARARPQTFVEEANLKIQVSALRRALGDGQGDHRFIVTVPGRGYNFVASVSARELPGTPPPAPIALAGVHNLPLAATRMIGRDEAVAVLVPRGPDGIFRRASTPDNVPVTGDRLRLADRRDCPRLVDLRNHRSPTPAPAI